MKKLVSILLITFFMIVSCKKDNSNTDTSSNLNFAPGHLAIGITNNADLKTVFATLDTLKLRISSMWGFFYNSNLPADSVNYLIKLLNQKPYIDTGAWSASAYFNQSENTIVVLCFEFNMTQKYQADFLKTIASLNLVDTHGNTKDMYLNVPIGTEKYWLNELKKYPFITWTELDYYVQINGDP